MDNNLQHEDLLIKLRAKLNEEKIKLWEPPYQQADEGASNSLKELAEKYSVLLSQDINIILQALLELQEHSLERSKANAQFKETGLATFRVKATGSKLKVFNIKKKLDISANELFEAVASEIGVSIDRLKLICNGRVIKPITSLVEQNIKNGAQIMALVLGDNPDNVKKEDAMYMEMKSTRDDAMLLSECVDDLVDDDYMKLEDQSGKAVELPAAERRSLMVGLALHERGRTALQQKDYALALVLLLEADRQFSECSSSLLMRVDNVAVLQLDISWCYVCLRLLSSAADAAVRLQRAEASFIHSYGENHERLIALKGNASNERVLFMRLYLLQGIVAYHQNKRSEADRLFQKAEAEMVHLRVDENSISALMELGWSRTRARTGLRTAGGDVNKAHLCLEEMREQREKEREKHRLEKLDRLLGSCPDGGRVSSELLSLLEMGYSRRLALAALRLANNNVTDAIHIIQEQSHMLNDSDFSSSDTESSDEPKVEPDNKLVAGLEAMGYNLEDVKAALKLSKNEGSKAVELLLEGTRADTAGSSNPSTSAGTSKKSKQKKREIRMKERELALKRLKSGVTTEEDDYLDTTLVEEEQLLAQYKSLL